MTYLETIKELKFWRDEMLVTQQAKQAFTIAIKSVEKVAAMDLNSNEKQQISIDDILKA